MSTRFFLADEAEPGQTVVFPPQDAHKILHVLRLRRGDTVWGISPSGAELEIHLQEVQPSSPVTGEVRRVQRRLAEPELQVVLAPALLKGERFDWVIQKATELGAAAIMPWQSERSIVQITASKVSGRLGRWQRIAEAAAEQSRRTRIPHIFPPLDTTQLIGELEKKFDERSLWLPWEEEKQHGFLTQFRERWTEIKVRRATVVIFIGPEGGVTAAEAERIRSAGGTTVHLGTRVLRAETASVVALSLVFGVAGELG